MSSIDSGIQWFVEETSVIPAPSEPACIPQASQPTNAGARAQGGLTPDFLALSSKLFTWQALYIILLRARCHRAWSVPVEGGPRVAPEEHKLVTEAYDHLEVSRIAEVTLDECHRLDRCLPRQLATENG